MPNRPNSPQRPRRRRTLVPPERHAASTPVPPNALTMRPPYRRGHRYIRCGLRLRKDLLDALRVEGRRRRQWVSALAEDLLRQGLERLRGQPLAQVPSAAAAEPAPPPGTPRHWVRLALDGPVWDALQRIAQETPYSVAQLLRQQISEAALAQAAEGARHQGPSSTGDHEDGVAPRLDGQHHPR